MTDAAKSALPGIPIASNPLEQLTGKSPEWRAARKIYQYRSDEAAKIENVRTSRTDLFAKFILDIAALAGSPVPYAFKLSSGEPTSLDWGCVGFLLNCSPPEIRLIEEGGFVVAVEPTEALYRRYGRKLPATLADQMLLSDVRIIENKRIAETTRKQLIDARLGQGQFRIQLLEVWQDSCAVTGCDHPSLLRASHIKPWRDASDEERLDPSNGLMLCAHLDAVFDVGLISFAEDGQMIASPSLLRHRDVLSGLGRPLRAAPGEATRRYLSFHRRVHKDRLGYV